jgi:RNA polymerase sigma-70 factor (sigma-E family)
MRSHEDDDRREFNEYFAARREIVRHAAYLMCGDWHWADDLAQGAFIRVAAAWGRIRDRQALDAFVRTCLVRTYLAETRRVWRRRERVTAELPDHATGDDDAEGVTRRVLFAKALAQVPPRQRATLIYRFYLGLSVAESAEALGCSEGTVKSQTAKGLAALRGVLSDALPAPAPVCATEGNA